MFEGSSALLAIADEVKEIEQICDCREKANFHLRLIDGKLDTSKNAVAIEKGNITYESVCRRCWKEKTGR